MGVSIAEESDPSVLHYYPLLSDRFETTFWSSEFLCGVVDRFMQRGQSNLFSRSPSIAFSKVHLNVLSEGSFESQGTMTPTKRFHLNFFETACTGSHMSVGAWKYAAIDVNYLFGKY